MNQLSRPAFSKQAVDESYAFYDLRHQLISIEAPPVLNGLRRQFKTIVSLASLDPQPLVCRRPIAHRRESGLDRVVPAQVRPILGGKIIEDDRAWLSFSRQATAVGHFARYLLRERSHARSASARVVASYVFMDEPLGAWLDARGQLLEHAGRHIHPAALPACNRKLFLQRALEAE